MCSAAGLNASTVPDATGPVLPADALSPYEFGIPVEDLRPTPDEASGLVEAAAREWADPDALATAIERWYVTP